jgi:hypothetical protein
LSIRLFCVEKKVENIFSDEHFGLAPPVREDSHCYLLDHSCDEAGADSDDDSAGNLKFRNNLLKIPRNSKASGSAHKEGDAGDAEWRDSVFSGGAESGRCASCTDLIVGRAKKGGKLKFDVGDRDSADLSTVGCLPSCSSRGHKFSVSKSGGGNLQANNWCCGVGAIASTVKRTTKKLE